MLIHIDLIWMTEGEFLYQKVSVINSFSQLWGKQLSVDKI